MWDDFDSDDRDDYDEEWLDAQERHEEMLEAMSSTGRGDFDDDDHDELELDAGGDDEGDGDDVWGQIGAAIRAANPDGDPDWGVPQDVLDDPDWEASGREQGAYFKLKYGDDFDSDDDNEGDYGDDDDGPDDDDGGGGGGFFARLRGRFGGGGGGDDAGDELTDMSEFEDAYELDPWESDEPYGRDGVGDGEDVGAMAGEWHLEDDDQADAELADEANESTIDANERAIDQHEGEDEDVDGTGGLNLL